MKGRDALPSLPAPQPRRVGRPAWEVGENQRAEWLLLEELRLDLLSVCMGPPDQEVLPAR